MASGSRESATEWDWQPEAGSRVLKGIGGREPAAEGEHTTTAALSQPLLCVLL